MVGGARVKRKKTHGIGQRRREDGERRRGGESSDGFDQNMFNPIIGNGETRQ